MNDEEAQAGRFCDDYYRDGRFLIIISTLILCLSMVMLCGVSLWLFFSKPVPVYFKTQDNWRLLPPVPVDQPYISQPSLIQWVSNVLPTVFSVDFFNYQTQMKTAIDYFTPDGWKKFQAAINHYANANVVSRDRLFVSTSATGAPFILNQGMIHGAYGWWIQMPLNLRYSSAVPGTARSMTVQVLVVRVSTLNDLKGVKIDNMIIKEEDQSAGNE